MIINHYNWTIASMLAVVCIGKREVKIRCVERSHHGLELILTTTSAAHARALDLRLDLRVFCLQQFSNLLSVILAQAIFKWYILPGL